VLFTASVYLLIFCGELDGLTQWMSASLALAATMVVKCQWMKVKIVTDYKLCNSYKCWKKSTL